MGTRQQVRSAPLRCVRSSTCYARSNMARRIGIFRIDGTIASPPDRQRFARVPSMLVDPDSSFTWIPEPLLRQAGIRPVKEDLVFQSAAGPALTRSIGYAILRACAFETVDEVVFAQPRDLTILGARTLSGFGA